MASGNVFAHGRLHGAGIFITRIARTLAERRTIESRVREVIVVPHVFAVPLRGSIQCRARLERSAAVLRAVVVDNEEERLLFQVEPRGLSPRTFAAIAGAIGTGFTIVAREIAANGTTAAARR